MLGKFLRAKAHAAAPREAVEPFVKVRGHVHRRSETSIWW